MRPANGASRRHPRVLQSWRAGPSSQLRQMSRGVSIMSSTLSTMGAASLWTLLTSFEDIKVLAYCTEMNSLSFSGRALVLY